jgi:hypothetical protein
MDSSFSFEDIDMSSHSSYSRRIIHFHIPVIPPIIDEMKEMAFTINHPVNLLSPSDTFSHPHISGKPN